MKMRILLLTGVAVLAVVVLYLHKNNPAGRAEDQVTDAKDSAGQISPQPNQPERVEPAQGPLTANADVADPEFQKFISEEAKQVDSTHLDSAAKTRELAEVTAKLTPSQSKQLLQTALNANAPAGERILSAYLMVEAGARAQAELQKLITAPFDYPGAHPAHSELEMRSMQERSLRVMALEGLISRAEKDASAQDALAKTIPDIPDPYMQKYAEKRASEIKAH